MKMISAFVLLFGLQTWGIAYSMAKPVPESAPAEQTPELSFSLGEAGVILACGMALAALAIFLLTRRQGPVDPPAQHCGNCGRYGDLRCEDCATCAAAWPDTPSWIPADRGGAL